MVDRERLKYLTRTAFVESKRRLVQDRILKWHTRLVTDDGSVCVMPHIPDSTLSAGNLLGLAFRQLDGDCCGGDDSRYQRLDIGNDARANPVVAGESGVLRRLRQDLRP